MATKFEDLFFSVCLIMFSAILTKGLLDVGFLMPTPDEKSFWRVVRRYSIGRAREEEWRLLREEIDGWASLEASMEGERDWFRMGT